MLKNMIYSSQKFVILLLSHILFKMKCNKCLLKSDEAQNLDIEELGRMDRNCVQINFAPNEVIFKQDALSSNVIFLQSGLVKNIIKTNYKKHIIKINKAPSYLGLPTTFGDKVNHYSAVAITDVVACNIDIETFKELLRSNSDFSYSIIVRVCKNELEYLSGSFVQMQKQSGGRVAEAILNFSNNLFNSDSFTLPFTRSEFGDLTGNSREIISRTLHEFSKEGIIELKGRNIAIIDKKRLEQISRAG